MQYLHDYIVSPFQTLGFSRSELVLSIGGILVLMCTEYAVSRVSLQRLLDEQSVFVRSFVYSLFALSIVLFGVFATKQFIYFQF